MCIDCDEDDGGDGDESAWNRMDYLWWMSFTFSGQHIVSDYLKLEHHDYCPPPLVGFYWDNNVVYSLNWREAAGDG